jgi:hypothetical protein
MSKEDMEKRWENKRMVKVEVGLLGRVEDRGIANFAGIFLTT